MSRINTNIAALQAIHSLATNQNELALRLNWDKCSVRPRLTELSELGCAATNGERRNAEHVYKFVPLALAEHTRMLAQTDQHQGEFPL